MTPRRALRWAGPGALLAGAALLAVVVVRPGDGPAATAREAPAPVSSSASSASSASLSSVSASGPSPSASTPAVASVSPSPTTAAASASPTREPVPAPPPVQNAAAPELDVTAVVGPPPGPQADPRPARTAAPADRFALLVGVQDYRPPTVDTIGSARDVELVRQQLVDAGWPAGNVRVLVDDQATGAAVRAGLDWLVARSRPGTFALFHYSGHVKQLGGTTEALWPVDRGFVRDHELAAVLSRSQGRLWVDVAGCEGASFMDGLPSERTLFSGSSKGTEKSYEQPAWGTSVWTGLLFDQGLRQGHADADRDGRTTVGESLRWAQWAAQAVTAGQRPHGRQTPQFAGAPDLGWTLADPPA